MAKKVDPFKAKQKRQKIIAAVLGVLFLGLLGFQLPRLMKQLHPSAPVVNTAVAHPSGTPSLAAPTLQGSQGPATTTTPGSTPLASSTAPLQDGQLASFSRFASKDPFSQQLSDHSSGGSSSGGSSSSSSNPDKLPAIPGNAPAPGSAVISVNGTLYDVIVGADFPQATTDPSVVPLFHLISLTAHTARISIAGGSYSNGAPSVILKENKAVTLMNTADGTRYKLVLEPQGTSPDSPGNPSPTTTVTLPSATP
jgi:hypothetical protein